MRWNDGWRRSYWLWGAMAIVVIAAMWIYRFGPVFPKIRITAKQDTYFVKSMDYSIPIAIDHGASVSEIQKMINANPSFAHNTRWNGQTLLEVAVIANRYDLVPILISDGFDVNDKIPGNTNGQTPLMNAVNGNDTRMAKLLLDGGADPNIPDADGTTAVQAARSYDNNELVKLLQKKRQPTTQPR